MAKAKYFYAIDATVMEDGFMFRPFIDMLRYDRATVEGTADGFIVLSSDQRPTVARWASWLIRVFAISHDYYDTIDRAKAEHSAAQPMLEHTPAMVNKMTKFLNDGIASGGHATIPENLLAGLCHEWLTKVK